MNIEGTIGKTLSEALQPTHLEVINESDNHNVPANSETHFKVVIVSQAFNGESLIKRHRQINTLLAKQLAGGVHALSLHTMTPDEWARKNGQVAESPECLGGGKAGDGKTAQP